STKPSRCRRISASRTGVRLADICSAITFSVMRSPGNRRKSKMSCFWRWWTCSARLRRGSALAGRVMAVSSGIQYQQQVAGIDRFARRAVDAADPRAAVGMHGKFHLHRLDDQQGMAGLDLLPRLHQQLPDIAADVRRHCVTVELDLCRL